MKMDLFWWKKKIYGHDQNVRSPEKFCLCDVEHFRSHFQKRVPKCSISERKNFSGDPIFWSCPYISFFHQNMWIFIFWTPCMAKIAFYWLGLSIFEKKRLPKCSTSETQHFSRGLIFWLYPYISFFTKIRGFSFFG